MRTKTIFGLLTLAMPAFHSSILCASDYAVVVSSEVHQDAEWAAVVEALVTKHDASVIEFADSIEDILPELRELFPSYTCFVVPPDSITPELVQSIHQMTRTLDQDPYTDTLWAILTGYDAANALAIAEHREPLEINKVASGTEFAINLVTEGLWYDELVKNKFVQKFPGKNAEQTEGPDDTTQALADTLQDYRPDLFITSGHATEANWQIGFSYKNGYFKSEAGQMFGLDSEGSRIEIDSPNAKVYLPVGNCLMGNIANADSMALAWMNDIGVKQMAGYMRPTWFGYMGWGLLDYFVEQPGRYTLTEAFHANNHALIHRLEDADTPSPDIRGLTFDRDVVAFYGDPKWSARMAPAESYFKQELSIDEGNYTLTITPNRGSDSFKPVNTNGSQRGGRPIIEFLPDRVSNVKITNGNEFRPVITDDFILIPKPDECDPEQPIVIRFTAEAISTDTAGRP